MNVSHILAQPTVDSWDGDPEPCGSVDDGVECSRAFKMVMPFATSSDRVDAISQKLKDGCVLNKGGGGCKVKASVMWEVLDNAMSEV
jgi:hypothetical protein